MEEYSESKIYKGKVELRSNVSADYFYSSAEILESITWCLLKVNHGKTGALVLIFALPASKVIIYSTLL